MWWNNVLIIIITAALLRCSYKMFKAERVWLKKNSIFARRKWKHKDLEEHRAEASVFTNLHEEQFSFIMRKTSLPVDRVDCSVDFDWLHQSLSGYSGAGDSEVSLSPSPSLWQKLLLNGRVASFSAGVPSGPTGRDNQTGQLQTDRQTGRCSRLKLFLPDSDTFCRICDGHLWFSSSYELASIQQEPLFLCVLCVITWFYSPSFPLKLHHKRFNSSQLWGQSCL